MAKIDVSSMELEERVVTINRVSKTVKSEPAHAVPVQLRCAVSWLSRPVSSILR